MKKFIVIIVLCVFGFGTYTSIAGEKLNKGIRGGWQYSNLYKDGHSLFDDPLNSFYVGVFANKKFLKTKILQLNTALTYYQVGSKTNDNNRLNLHYLNLPVSLKVKIGPVYAFGGLNGAVKFGGESYVLGIKNDVKDFSTFDAGVFLGAGVKILFFGFEAKYDLGLIDVSGGYKTQYLQVGFLVYF